MPSTKSRVHLNYKTKSRVGNWAGYDLSLVERDVGVARRQAQSLVAVELSEDAVLFKQVRHG
jgi:hypothetical protein